MGTYPLRKTITLKVSLWLLNLVSPALTLWTPKHNHYEKAGCVLRPYVFHYRWDEVLSHFNPPSSACCWAKYNPSEKDPESKPFISAPSGQPALYFVSATKRASLILILTSARDYRWEWAWLELPACCWLKLHPGNLAPHLVTGCGIWQRFIQKEAGTEIAQFNSAHTRRHKNMNSYMVLLENRSAFLKPIKSLWSLRFLSEASGKWQLLLQHEWLFQIYNWVFTFCLSCTVKHFLSNCWSENILLWLDLIISEVEIKNQSHNLPF